ncbi:MAG: putative ABC-type sugar transport system periplasmic component [Solirubrobacterales bacterium]|nr:putative ABC-type sugar transport system periplasmic component [Solirubrobacterales bacterium]
MRRITMALLTGAACAAALAACGSSDSGNDATPQAAAAGSVGADLAAFQASAKKIVAEKTAPQTNKPPTTGPKAVAGKHIFTITPAASAEGAIRFVTALERAYKAIGWENTTLDGQGDPTVMASAIRKAIAAKADGIVTISIDDNIVQGALREAKRAGIPVVTAASQNKSGLYTSTLVDLDVANELNYAAAAYLYDKLGGKLHVIEMTDPEFVDDASRQAAFNRFIKECAAAGGDCKMLESQNFLIKDLATSLPSQAANLARKNPGLNAVWIAYDSALAAALPGLRSAGVADKAIAASQDGNSVNLDYIRKGEFQVADITFPATWCAYGMVDNLNRVFAGEKPLDGMEQGFAYKLLVKENLQPKGLWDGDADVSGDYVKIWTGQ